MFMKKVLLSLLATGLLLQASSTHWGYTGHTSPEHWGDISPDFAMCKIGKNQSPINIAESITLKTQALNPIEFDYHADATEVVNNGHAIQVNVDSHSSITIDGKHFVLKQFHFHSPSENEINGKSFPLEAHFVHISKKGEIAVIAVLFELGKPNKSLQKVWEGMPQKAGEHKSLTLTSEEIAQLLPQNKEYYYFNGSLTTPPCSEGVKWMVMKNYITISKEQLKMFTQTMGVENNRPVQPINARKVLQ